MKTPGIDMTGRQYGRLTVIRRGEKTNKSRQAFWVCRCECGRESEICGATMRRGNARSCGCLQRDTARVSGTKHGGAGMLEYGIWRGMKQRCHNPRSRHFRLYGERGIAVCDRWRNDFAAFLADMGPMPSPVHTIDRFPDRDGDYRPENCRWATRKEQGRNTSRNRRLEFRGETKTVAEWAEQFGLSYELVSHRINVSGWNIETALTAEKYSSRRPRKERTG